MDERRWWSSAAKRRTGLRLGLASDGGAKNVQRGRAVPFGGAEQACHLATLPVEDESGRQADDAKLGGKITARIHQQREITEIVRAQEFTWPLGTVAVDADRHHGKIRA